MMISQKISKVLSNTRKMFLLMSFSCKYHIPRRAEVRFFLFEIHNSTNSVLHRYNRKWKRQWNIIYKQSVSQWNFTLFRQNNQIPIQWNQTAHRYSKIFLKSLFTLPPTPPLENAEILNVIISIKRFILVKEWV